MYITSINALRDLYAPARERSVKKQLNHLDVFCRKLIALSPFVVVASQGSEQHLDASPRGGDKGFCKVIDEHTLLIPDSPGNNRLDTLENIVASGRIGLLFLVPGIDETLRVNGTAKLSTSPHHLDQCQTAKRRPPLVIEVTVEEAYLHCAKAVMRSTLWQPESQVARDVLPSMGEILKAQIGGDIPAETQEQMLVRYSADL
jgi:uncharacterized protein